MNNINNNLNFENLDDLSCFLQTLTPQIETYGGRSFKQKKGSKSFKLNDIVRAFQGINKGKGSKIKKATVIAQIRILDILANRELSKKPMFIRLATSIRQLFGNLFFNRKQVLDKSLEA